MPARSIHAKHNIKQFFKNNLGFLPIIGILSVASLAVINLRTPPTAADNFATSLTVGNGCSLTIDGSSEHTATLTPGLLTELDGVTLISTCNGAYDSSIYAVGYTNNVTGSTSLIDPSNPDSTTNSFLTSDTCTSSSASSCWSMKISPLTTDSHPFTPQNGYDSYRSIPSTTTQIASTTLKTDSNPKSTINTKYAIYSTSAQPAGTYTGKVKYTLNSQASVLKIYMQDMTSSQCVADPVTVYDNRDEAEYRVARLADGKCWMLDSLAIDTSTATMTTENTNMKSGVSAKANRASAFDSWTSPQINVSHKDDYVNCAMNQSCTGKVGVVYNYCAASAGTYCKSMGSLSGDAQYDVCPSGWRLPTGGESGEYNALYLAYNSDASQFSRELHLLLSGAVGSKGYVSANSWGSYWTSTRYSSYGMWILGAYTNQVIPIYRDPRYLSDGNTLRCVLAK